MSLSAASSSTSCPRALSRSVTTVSLHLATASGWHKCARCWESAPSRQQSVRLRRLLRQPHHSPVARAVDKRFRSGLWLRALQLTCRSSGCDDSSKPMLQPALPAPFSCTLSARSPFAILSSVLSQGRRDCVWDVLRHTQAVLKFQAISQHGLVQQGLYGGCNLAVRSLPTSPPHNPFSLGGWSVTRHL